jgi:hypothetical protein
LFDVKKKKERNLKKEEFQMRVELRTVDWFHKNVSNTLIRAGFRADGRKITPDKAKQNWKKFVNWSIFTIYGVEKIIPGEDNQTEFGREPVIDHEEIFRLVEAREYLNIVVLLRRDEHSNVVETYSTSERRRFTNKILESRFLNALKGKVEDHRKNEEFSADIFNKRGPSIPYYIPLDKLEEIMTALPDTWVEVDAFLKLQTMTAEEIGVLPSFRYELSLQAILFSLLGKIGAPSMEDDKLYRLICEEIGYHPSKNQTAGLRTFGRPYVKKIDELIAFGSTINNAIQSQGFETEFVRGN